MIHNCVVGTQIHRGDDHFKTVRRCILLQLLTKVPIGCHATPDDQPIALILIHRSTALGNEDFDCGGFERGTKICFGLFWQRDFREVLMTGANDCVADCCFEATESISMRSVDRRGWRGSQSVPS